MCAQFTLIKTLKELTERLNLTILEEILFPNRVVPSSKAPVVTKRPEGRDLRTMRFGLIPSWSKEPNVKFATYNARLMSDDKKTGKQVPIYEKPTWRSAFQTRHCLVPMTTFIEPIYDGELAGNMVSFGREDQGILIAAGIWEEWANTSTGEVIPSFAILTDDPLPFVEKLGHDRSPVFLKDTIFDEWLNPRKDGPKEFIKLLRENKEVPPLVAAIDRPLAKGWERRA